MPMPRPGIFSIQQPVMAPVNMFDARAREDVLIAAAKQINPQALPKQTPTVIIFMSAGLKFIKVVTSVHLRTFGSRL